MTPRVTGDRSTRFRTSGFRDRNSGGYRPQNREWQPRPPQDDHHMAREELLGPCTFHFFFDGEGRRRSTHALKDCRKFIVLQETYANVQRSALNQGYPVIPGQPAINAPPPRGPPPAPATQPRQQPQQAPGAANAIQPYDRSRGKLSMVHRVVRENNPPELEPYPKSRGSICMI